MKFHKGHQIISYEKRLLDMEEDDFQGPEQLVIQLLTLFGGSLLIASYLALAVWYFIISLFSFISCYLCHNHC